MKNIIIILLLSPLFGFAQIDSANVKINVSIQARDAEYLGSFISFKEEYDELFDALKLKMRLANPPINQSLVAIDSISVRTWLSMMQHIRTDYIAVQAGIFTRVDAVLRAKNNAYLTRLLNDANTFDQRQYVDRRRMGRYNIRKSEN